MHLCTNATAVSEGQIREALRNFLIEGADAGAVVRDELSINYLAERIDVARIGSRLEGFEIKSDFDRLDRLGGQVSAFGGVFDELTLVTGPSLATSGALAVPAWWGLMLASFDEAGRVSLTRVRQPQQNPLQASNKIAGLLWREELALACQTLVGKSAPKRASRAQLCERLGRTVSVPALRDFVASRLVDQDRSALYRQAS
jgi:hypothetical protein